MLISSTASLVQDVISGTNYNQAKILDKILWEKSKDIKTSNSSKAEFFSASKHFLVADVDGKIMEFPVNPSVFEKISVGDEVLVKYYPNSSFLVEIAK